MLELIGRPREGRGREGRADNDPPGLGVGLNDPPESVGGNLICFIRAAKSLLLVPILISGQLKSPLEILKLNRLIDRNVLGRKYA